MSQYGNDKHQRRSNGLRNHQIAIRLEEKKEEISKLKKENIDKKIWKCTKLTNTGLLRMLSKKNQ